MGFFLTDLWNSANGGGLFSSTQLLVHEARHATGGGHTCANGNDSSVAQGGAWAAVVHWTEALAFHSDPCFMRPSLPSSPEFPNQLFDGEDYMERSRDFSYMIREGRFCDEPYTRPEPPEPVYACGL